MSEFAPLRDPAVVPDLKAPAPANAALADISPARKVEQRYVDAINALMKDAADHESLHILTDVLTGHWAA
jgi:hypothetical protein